MLAGVASKRGKAQTFRETSSFPVSVSEPSHPETEQSCKKQESEHPEIVQVGTFVEAVVTGHH